MRKGDSVDKIYFVKNGQIEVHIPIRKKESMMIEVLNPGSCFCAYSAFHDEIKQRFDFKAATSSCIVETISAKDVFRLQKENLELSDELKTLRALIET